MNNIGCNVRKEIVDYVEESVLPAYDSFDSAHKRDHALTVISQAMKLLDTMPEGWTSGNGSCKATDCGEGCGTAKGSLAMTPDGPASQDAQRPDREMLFVAAACHDLGLRYGRENHHLDSGKIIRNTPKLREWFGEEQVEIIAQAAEDHRASSKTAPRSIYGMIVAEADRVIDTDIIIIRCLQFGFKHYPQLERDGHIDRAVEHLKEKYGRGGYLRLWIPWSDNARRLEDLQNLIADTPRLRLRTAELYDSLAKQDGLK